MWAEFFRYRNNTPPNEAGTTNPCLEITRAHARRIRTTGKKYKILKRNASSPGNHIIVPRRNAQKIKLHALCVLWILRIQSAQKYDCARNCVCALSYTSGWQLRESPFPLASLFQRTTNHDKSRCLGDFSPAPTDFSRRIRHTLSSTHRWIGVPSTRISCDLPARVFWNGIGPVE